ncbi:hypothetical protein KPH14_005972 [Odynerus spinipes]|uniref:Uncharacterized protein n=1 Tax=Odynerus spinipes TaxID=1348599 RepID=A0AAD9RJI6_9HYME|nr:hypothetical protein KPH14_005972 [Odynerus spinipes]
MNRTNKYTFFDDIGLRSVYHCTSSSTHRSSIKVTQILKLLLLSYNNYKSLHTFPDALHITARLRKSTFYAY